MRLFPFYLPTPASKLVQNIKNENKFKKINPKIKILKSSHLPPILSG